MYAVQEAIAHSSLHGYFLAGWHVLTDRLLPVFSQSKIDGCFSDITVPTWMNSNVQPVHPEEVRTCHYRAQKPLTEATSVSGALSCLAQSPGQASLLAPAMVTATRIFHPPNCSQAYMLVADQQVCLLQVFGWRKRKPMLYFRGTSTGGQVDNDTNFESMHRQRLIEYARNRDHMDVGFVGYVQCQEEACQRMEARHLFI